MNRALLTRLEKLEAKQRDAKRAAPKPPPISVYLLAYFGNNHNPIESPAGNYARALGCETSTDFHALTPEQVAERHAKALERLLKRRKLPAMVKKLSRPT